MACTCGHLLGVHDGGPRQSSCTGLAPDGWQCTCASYTHCTLPVPPQPVCGCGHHAGHHLSRKACAWFNCPCRGFSERGSFTEEDVRGLGRCGRCGHYHDAQRCLYAAGKRGGSVHLVEAPCTCPGHVEPEAGDPEELAGW